MHDITPDAALRLCRGGKLRRAQSRREVRSDQETTGLDTEGFRRDYDGDSFIVILTPGLLTPGVFIFAPRFRLGC